MRIVWKDSGAPQTYKTMKYRDCFITGYYNDGVKGWITDLPNDNNIYKSNYCAMNAIDAALGGYSRRGKPTEKRLSYGIQIIGKKNNEAG